MKYVPSSVLGEHKSSRIVSSTILHHECWGYILPSIIHNQIARKLKWQCFLSKASVYLGQLAAHCGDRDVMSSDNIQAFDYNAHSSLAGHWRQKAAVHIEAWMFVPQCGLLMCSRDSDRMKYQNGIFVSKNVSENGGRSQSILIIFIPQVCLSHGYPGRTSLVLFPILIWTQE